MDKLEREVKNLGREVEKGEEYVRTLEEMIDRWAEEDCVEKGGLPKMSNASFFIWIETNSITLNSPIR